MPKLIQKMKTNDSTLEILVPSNVLNFNKYRLIPHAIEMGGAYWTKKHRVKFHIMWPFNHRENLFINDQRDSKGDRRATRIKDASKNTKYTKVEPKFLMIYLLENPFSSK